MSQLYNIYNKNIRGYVGFFGGGLMASDLVNVLSPTTLAGGTVVTTDPNLYGSVFPSWNTDTGGWGYWNPNPSDIPVNSSIDFAALVYASAYLGLSTIPNVEITANIQPIVIEKPDGTTLPVTPNPNWNLDFDVGWWQFTHGQDITNIMQDNQYGQYKITGIPVGDSSFGCCAGWGIYIVYSNPSFPYRNINLNVGATGFNSTITIPNLILPTTGPVSSSVYALAVQGDRGIYPDSLLLNNVPLSGPFNPVGDFMNDQYVDYTGNSLQTIGCLITTADIGGTPTDWSWYVDQTVILTSTILQNNDTEAIITQDNNLDWAGVAQIGLMTDLLAANITPVKYVDKFAAKPGDILNYTVEMSNTGTTTAVNVIFTDTFPAAQSMIGGSLLVNGVGYPGDITTGITLPDINPLAITTISYQSVVPTTILSGNMLNLANLDYYFEPSLGTLVHSNVNSNLVSTTIVTANLSTIVKTVSNTAAALGDILTYTIALSNTGNVSANNIILIDTIPIGTSLLPGSLKQDGLVIAGSPNPPGIPLPNPIESGQTSTVTFQVIVNSLPTATQSTIVNSATALFSYLGSQGTLSASNNSNIEEITVNGSAIINTAAATFSFFVTPTLVFTGGGNSNQAPTNIYSPIISAIKTTDKVNAVVGETLTYTIVLNNSGNTTATNYLFTDTIPEGTVFVPNSLHVNGSLIPVSPAPPTGITIPDLGIGQTTTISFQVTAISVPTNNPTTNSGVSHYNFIVDPSQGTIRSGATITNIVYTTIVSNPIISILKTVDKDGAFVGNVLNYSILFENTGSSTGNNIHFSDTTPNGTSFVSNSVQINGVTQIGATLNPPSGITIPAIGPGQITTLTYQVLVNTIPVQNPVLNQGTASYPTFTGISIVNTNTVATHIYHNVPPVKSSNSSNVNIGDIVTYTLKWTEMDGVTAHNVIFIDTIPSATSFIPNSVIVNGIALPGTTILPPLGLNVGSVNPNQTVTVTFQVKVNSL